MGELHNKMVLDMKSSSHIYHGPTMLPTHSSPHGCEWEMARPSANSLFAVPSFVYTSPFPCAANLHLVLHRVAIYCGATLDVVQETTDRSVHPSHT